MDPGPGVNSLCGSVRIPEAKLILKRYGQEIFLYSFPHLINCTVPDPGQKEPGSSFYTPRTPVCFPNFLPMHYEIDLVKIDVEEKKN